jgi:hypothetical protein
VAWTHPKNAPYKHYIGYKKEEGKPRIRWMEGIDHTVTEKG